MTIRSKSPSPTGPKSSLETARLERRVAAIAELLGVASQPSESEHVARTTEGASHVTSMQPDRLLLRAEEAAFLLGIGRTKVFEMVRAGDIPVIRIGRLMRIPRDALTAWIDSHTIAKHEGDRIRKEHLESA